MKKIIEKISKIRKVSLRVGLTIVGTFLAPAIALAVVQTLNGATGQTQTFVDDNNITVTTNTSANTHTFGWSGLLPVSRGGTGAGSFTAGSVLFSNGSSISQDNANLFWDDAADIFSVHGIKIWQESVGDRKNIDSPSGFHLQIRGSPPLTSTSDGGGLELEGGMGGSTSGKGGDIMLTAGNPQNGNGGNVILVAGEGNGAGNFGGNIELFAGFNSSGDGSGKLKFWNGDAVGAAIIDVEPLTTQRTFSFPNISGIFSILSAEQTFTGLNKFESTASSSVYIGSPTKSGCIVMGDSDGSGVTYITANDGVLTASSIKPSICQ